MRAWRLALCGLLLGGCALQGGAYAGRNFATRGGRDHFTWGGQLQPRLVLPSGRGQWHLGVELEGRAEAPTGSIPSWGAQLGRAFELSPRVSLAPLLDLGLPMGWSSPIDGWYAGVSLELPIVLGAIRDPSEVNRSYRFVAVEGALVPFVRARRYALEIRAQDRPPDYEIAIGVAVRTRVLTDLVDL